MRIFVGSRIFSEFLLEQVAGNSLFMHVYITDLGYPEESSGVGRAV